MLLLQILVHKEITFFIFLKNVTMTLENACHEGIPKKKNSNGLSILKICCTSDKNCIPAKLVFCHIIGNKTEL